MKVAHRNKAIDEPIEHKPQEWLAEAKIAEAKDDVEEAIKLYEQVVKADDLNEFAYNRLMVLYRKEKNYAKEIKLIDKGIAAFQKHYKSSTKHNRTIASVSEKLNKAFGLTDKKGNQLYDPEPIGKWKKRRVVAEKRVK
jgi:tetratricopeptide (TPR) repeat protein